MQTLLQISEISKRIKRIGVVPTDLSKRAGVNYATFYRGLKAPGGTSSRNLAALSSALIAIEIEMRDYLLGLHPVEAQPQRHPEAAE